MSKFLVSSVNPEQVSLTVKGVMALIVPLATLVLNHYGRTVDSNLASQLTEAITNFVVVASTLVASAMMLWGLVRKFYHSL